MEQNEKTITLTQEKNSADNLISFLHQKLKEQTKSTLSLSLTLANDKNLLDALESENEEMGFRVLNSKLANLQEFFNQQIKAQVLTNNLFVFARSWDEIFSGFPIEDFRYDLKEINSHKISKSGLVVGRLLIHSSASPIIYKNQYYGIIEIISFFDSITNDFREMGVDFFVLMDDKFLDKAILMNENLTIDEFVVGNKNINHKAFARVQKIDFESLKIMKIHQENGYYYIYEPMLDKNSKQIGIYLFSFKQNRLKEFAKNNQNISYFINFTREDLYDMEVKKNSLFDEIEEQNIFLLKNEISKEDYETYRQTLKSKLSKYNKTELIEMIIDHKKENKRGEIR